MPTSNLRSSQVDRLTSRVVDQKGRQAKNGGDATDPQDFVTLKQLNNGISLIKPGNVSTSNITNINGGDIYVSVKKLGALGNGTFGNASISNGTNTVTLTAGTVSLASVGNLIRIAQAGAGGITLNTTIASFIDSMHFTVTLAASATITSQPAVWGSDDYTAIQAAFDGNQNNTIYFPKGIYICSQTIILTDHTGLSGSPRDFCGLILGENHKAVYLVFMNDGTSSDTDAGMQHGFGCYNRVFDPNNGSSEVGGLQNTKIDGITLFAPDYGVAIFMGNSNFCQINNCFFYSLQGNGGTIWCRHYIVIDCGIAIRIDRCFFEAAIVSNIGVIKSGDTSTGHVVYTNFPPFSGFFNDSFYVTYCSFEGNCDFCILDHGTGSFTNRIIEGNIASGRNAPSGIFYGYGSGVAATLLQNWVETCQCGVLEIDQFLTGNIPFTSTPYAYFNQGIPGASEQLIVDGCEFANTQYAIYLQAGGNVTVTHCRVNGTSSTGAFVYKTGSTGTLEFDESNIAIAPAVGYVLLKCTFPSVVLRLKYPTWMKFAYELSGGNWVCNGVVQTAALALTFQDLYAIQLPAFCNILRILIIPKTIFSGTGLTSANLSTASFGGGDSFFGTVSLDLTASPSNTNFLEIVGRGLATLASDAVGVVVRSNINWNSTGLVGAFDLYLLIGYFNGPSSGVFGTTLSPIQVQVG